MNCTLKFYKLPITFKNKNFIIDDLKEYLSTFTPLTITGFQYQRLEINKIIKVNFSQDYQVNINEIVKYNYLVILASVDEEISTNVGTYYYFITNTRQVSQSCIELTLRMDTLNTFSFSNISSNKTYTLSDKTLVKREHKDRFSDVNKSLGELLEATPSQKEIIADFLWEMSFDNTTAIYAFPIQPIYEKVVGENVGGVGVSLYNGSTYGIKVNGTLVAKVRFEIDGIYGDDENGDEMLFIPWPSLNSFVPIQFIDIGYAASIYEFNSGAFAYVFFGVYNPDWDYAKDHCIVTNIYGEGATARRVIDQYQEGINPLLFKKDEEKLLDFDKNNTWYVIYSSINAVIANPNDTEPKFVNPVEVMIGADDVLSFKVQSAFTKRVDAGIIPNMPNSQEYIVIPKSIFSNGGTIKIAGVTYDNTSSYWTNYDYMVIRKKNANDLTFADMFFAAPDLTDYKFGDRTAAIVSSFTYFDAYNINNVDLYTGNNIADIGYWKKFVIGSNAQNITLTSSEFKNVDLTEPRFIKIINLPYCPVGWIDSLNNIVVDGNYVFNGEFELIEASESSKVQFDRNIEFKPLINPFSHFSFDHRELSNRLSRDIYFESKLYHSDFYTQKFVYDSFGFTFKLEDVDVSKLFTNFNLETLQIRYVVSKNIQSKFMFQFNQYVCKRATQDYENILIIERNNEVALYNHAYINYLRSGGYSYDTKKASSQNAMNGITTAFTIIGAVGSYASTPITGAKGIVGGIALTTTAISSILRSVHTAQEQDRAIAQKQLQLQNQSTNVSTCEDIDILKAYSGNKAKLVTYECSKVMKEAMWDLFHYCGYATHEQKIPNVKTRCNFNFVQADIVYDKYYFDEDIADDIKNKWSEGVTFFHRDSNDGTYDFNQIYENVENLLLED